MLGSKTKIAATLAAVAALMLPMSAASAAEQDLEFTNTGGEITIGDMDPFETTAGNAGLEGTWDDVTGEFVGTTTFNPSTVEVEASPGPPPVMLAVIVQLLNEDDNVTGTIDPETGEAELTATMQFQLTIPADAGDTVCTSPEFDVTFTSTEPFDPIPFDPEADYTISLEGDFTVPAFDTVAGCTPASSNPAIPTVINTTLGAPVAGTSTLDLVRGTPAPPTTPTTVATTTTTAAVVATSQPRFTG